MIVNVDLESILMRLLKSQHTHPAPEAEVVTPPQIMGCGQTEIG